VTDIPIIFSAPMVRALLDGRKTQTRRLAWREPVKGAEYDPRTDTQWKTKRERPSPWQKVKPGDRLWVKEGWGTDPCYDHIKPRDLKATWRIYTAHTGGLVLGFHQARSSRYMPRWASRLTLHVEAVKIERLQDISEEDARAEGVQQVGIETGAILASSAPVEIGSYAAAFCDLWESLHGRESWDANPEVVALTFRVEARNIDARRPGPTVSPTSKALESEATPGRQSDGDPQ